MNEPYVPTGEEFDEGKLPQRPRPERTAKEPDRTHLADRARRVREFVLEVSPDVDATEPRPER